MHSSKLSNAVYHYQSRDCYPKSFPHHINHSRHIMLYHLQENVSDDEKVPLKTPVEKSPSKTLNYVLTIIGLSIFCYFIVFVFIFYINFL